MLEGYISGSRMLQKLISVKSDLRNWNRKDVSLGIISARIINPEVYRI